MIIAIVGPTGVGKTDLAIELAKHYHAEIISGDSVQIYQELTIGSAKPSQEQRQKIPHHMIDILLPNETFSVADYQTMVREKIDHLTEKNIPVILVGGTGFYIKSVLHDFTFSGIPRPDSYDEKYKDTSNDILYQKLKKLDFKSTEKIHKNNRKRVLQALYKAEQGYPQSQETNQSQKVYDYTMIGLTMDKEELYHRINQRVDEMVNAGLEKEVKTLYDVYGETQSLEAIGYKELIGYFKGYYDKETAYKLIQTKSRQYAKKQYTYFNNQFDVHWIKTDPDTFQNTVSQAKHVINQSHKAAQKVRSERNKNC